MQKHVPAIDGVMPRTIYMGGGTPALLGVGGLKRLVATLGEHFDTAAVREWTVELNPASTNKEFLKALRQVGVNRVSIGAQIFDDSALTDVGRRHTTQSTLDAIKLAQDSGFENTGIDLIASLPSVTPETWEATLRQAVTLGLKHISVYSLMLEPGTPLAAQVTAGLKLAGDDEQLAALAQAESILTAEGFARYEISNYALPGYECCHNMAVWQGEDYLGLGPSASSRIASERWTNKAELQEYMNALADQREPPRSVETLSAYDDAFERALFALRLADGINPAAIYKRFPQLNRGEVASIWQKKLGQLERLGIVTHTQGWWKLTPRGREVCDAVLQELI